MQKHSKIFTAIGLVGLVSLFGANASLADNKEVREYSFELAAIDEVEFHGSVGSMEFVETTGTELKLVLVIEGEERG
jgi:hypothetical protein